MPRGLWIAGLLLILISCGYAEANTSRDKRYLISTPSTQWGVFVTIAIPLPEPTETTSVAWFFEANYYTVDNATWWHPLFGDTIVESRSQKEDVQGFTNVISRRMVYLSIEIMLEKHGLPGRDCLLRAICELATSHVHHHGVIGDLLYIILTPSSSASEDDIPDVYYKAQNQGTLHHCQPYQDVCPENPLDFFSMHHDEE